jgi:hypothetical protein
MRLALLLLVSGLAIAGSPEIKVPRPAPPKGLQLAVPQVPWWNSAEKARVASRSPFCFSEESLGKPKPMPFLLPYPNQAPPNARAYFFFQ